MTTSWRNTKEGFKESDKPNIENFASIPMFDVLYNDKYNNKHNDKIMEGMITCDPFNMFCSDYYQNVKRFKGVSGLNEIGDKIKSFLVAFANPTDSIDKWIEDSILNILKIYVNSTLEGCSKVEDKKKKKISKILPSFTWLQKFVIGKERFTTMQEGFNIPEKDVSGTISNLQNNHPNINKQNLARYYTQELNKLYKKFKGNVTQNDLFEFNIDMDTNKLTNPEIIKKINGIPEPTPRPTPIKFDEYMKTKSRFSFSSVEMIDYHPFLDQYFPLPNDITIKDFDSLIKKDFINNTNIATETFKTNGTTTVQLPNENSRNNENYIFSINLNKTEKQTISYYLNYIILYLSFVFIHNKKNAVPNNFTFTDIIPKIATVYLTFITYVEYLKFAQLNKYLTPKEIAIFNHIFYCCLNQTSETTDSSPYMYNIGKQTFSSENIIDPFINTLFTRISYQMQNDFQVEYRDNVWKYDENIKKTYPITNSLMVSTITNVVFMEFIHKVTASQDILIYYGTDHEAYLLLQQCKSKNEEILNQFREYSKIIKQELYRLFIIPIIIFIVYNFYYMFLFKDCFGYAKTVNNDEYVYEKTCKNGCFYPQFSDWEMNFHNMENHRTDFIFEFLFKPVKWFYTFLNAIKSVFFNNGILKLLSDYPYVCFLSMFALVYYNINIFGGKLLNIVIALSNMNTPTINIIGSITLNIMASSVVWLYFIISFCKETFYSNMFQNNTNSDENKKQTWTEWILDSNGSALIMVIKSICFIIYWIIRAMMIGLTIPLSIFICVVYFVWITIGSIFDYTDKSHNYNDKLELINRIIYSKLYELPKDELPKNTLKLLCFYAFYFLTEIMILFTLFKSMNNYQNMPIPTIGGDAAASAAYGIKTVMIFMYMIFIFLLVFWSAFKYYTQKTNMKESYGFDYGTHRLDNTGCIDDIPLKDQSDESAKYFNQNKYSFQSRILESDKLNAIFTKYYAEKTSHHVERPMVQKLLNSFVKMGKSFSEKINRPNSYDTIKPNTFFANISNIFKNNGN